ncbi:microtubule-associated protein futsch-like [Dermacentor silvarum]|uniref:microtubule-associated protein futsch-like n=1 Tax=Dermacentor silvarum TaxID=543639 RepID=UPI0021014D38|nr:microtubule-associated protein futsch-like [Dermacentor silvarum]
MSDLVQSELTDGTYSEEEGGSVSVSARYEPHFEDNQQPSRTPAASSEATTPASVQSPTQQQPSLRYSYVAPSPDTAPDYVGATVQQDGCDALAHSFAGLVSSLTDVLNACCGTAPPPADDPGEKKAAARSSRSTEPRKRDTEESAAGQTVNKKTTKSRDFLEDLVMDHRSPSELLEAELREKAEDELAAKFRQVEILREAGVPSDPVELDNLEKEREELLSSPPTIVLSSPSQEEQAADNEKFAVRLVPVAPDDETAVQESLTESVPPPPDATASMSPATPAGDRNVAAEHDGKEIASVVNREKRAGEEELDHGDDGGEGLEDGGKDDEHESHREEHLPDHEAEPAEGGGEGLEDGAKDYEHESHREEHLPDHKSEPVEGPGEHVSAGGTEVAAGETEAAADTQASEFCPLYLPPDVVQKIPDLPKGPASAVVSPESQRLSQQAPAPGTQDTVELVFRYKTRIGFTVALLFLTSVVVFTIAIGQFTFRGGQQEGHEEGTTLLTFPEWNKSENGRAQLMIPEEETERDILTLDIN